MFQIQKEVVRATVDLINKKWTLDLIRDLTHSGFSPKRFKDFLQQNPGLTTKVLSQRLTEMERKRLINKIVTPTNPPLSLYFGTDVGRDLMRILSSLSSFGLKWLYDENNGLFPQPPNNAVRSEISSQNQPTILPRDTMRSGFLFFNPIQSGSSNPINKLLKFYTSLTMHSLSKKWTMEIIIDLSLVNRTSIRFTEFLEQNIGLSRKVLSSRLKELEFNNYIKKGDNGSVNSYEYVLTEKGRELERILYELSVFGLQWFSSSILDLNLDKDQIDQIIKSEFNWDPRLVNFDNLPVVDQG